MKYIIKRDTKEHQAVDDVWQLYDKENYYIAQADSEGWIKHDGDECPLPDDAPCLLRFKAGSETGRTAGKHWCWDLGTISHYKPILEQEETTPAPQYDPRSVSFNLLKRLQAAHEAAQTIPDLEAKLREVLGSMGYDLVSRSPFVEPEAAVEPDTKTHTNLCQEDMSDWRNWRKGDVLECLQAYPNQFTVGSAYELLVVTGVKSPRATIKSDDSGKVNGLTVNCFRFHSRPAKGE